MIVTEPNEKGVFMQLPIIINNERIIHPHQTILDSLEKMLLLCVPSETII